MAEASKQTTEAGEYAQEGSFYMLTVMWISVSTMETCVKIPEQTGNRTTTQPSSVTKACKPASQPTSESRLLQHYTI